MSGAAPKRLLLLALCSLLTILFAGLGIWQVERLSWKRELITRVDARLAAPPVPLGPAAEGSRLIGRSAEYRRVTASGRFDHARETLVDALTERGKGYWVITPLNTRDRTILVNRGFVPVERRAPASRREGQIGGEVAVTGLIRLTEPGGRFLRPNRPSADLWYSRDVAAITRARGLTHAEPFFIDADQSTNPGGYPVGGLTIVRFRNAHLVYALTWFGLALLGAVGLVLVWRTPHIPS